VRTATRLGGISAADGSSGQKDLLRTANLTITEVCHLVGFTSLGSFSARFKELVGASPSAYQKEQAERGGPPKVPGCVVLMWSGAAVGDGLRQRAGMDR
jgi:hypothetical protein